MTDTTHLRLPYIIAAQAQKHVTHNEALRILDGLVHLAVLDRDQTTAPTSPDDGDRHIVAVGATGEWAGLDLAIALFADGAWIYLTPREGFIAWIADEDLAVVFDGTAWVDLASGGGGGGGGIASLNPATGGLVGVNATADTTNRLAVASAASLFSHAGTGGHQQKINKALATDTASVLYQTGFSGRAEIGTTGDDDFHFKVSPDGTAWYEAIVIDKDTGEVTFPNTTIGGEGGGGTSALIGAIIDWPTETAPAFALPCEGGAYSRTTYAALFAVIGTRYGPGDGSTTFNVPDRRGEFVRGWANGSASDPDRASRTNRGDGTAGDTVGTKQGFAIHNHQHSFPYLSATDSYSAGTITNMRVGTGNTDYTGVDGGTSTESRPRNVTTNYCIIFE